MSTLHIINKPSSNEKLWNALIDACQTGDDILLMEDACYALIDHSFEKLLSQLVSGIRVKVLESDALSRGLLGGQAFINIERTDYDGFVELSILHSKTISWHN